MARSQVDPHRSDPGKAPEAPDARPRSPLRGKSRRGVVLRGGFLVAVAAIVLWAAGVFHRGRIEPGGEGAPRGGPAALAAPETTFEVRAERVPLFEDAVGTVHSRSRVEVAAQVTARIVSVRAEAGDAVHAGDPLVDIDDREFAARLAQAREASSAAEATLSRAVQGEIQARARQAQAQADWERTKGFLESGAATHQQMERAEADHRSAEAAVAAAEAQIAAARAQREQARQVVTEAEIAREHSRIVSPIDGVVEQRAVEPGDLAWPGRPLLVVLDPGALRLEASVREGLIGGLRPGTMLTVELPAAGRTLEGRISEILPSADPLSRTFNVRVDLERIDGVHPGMFGRMRIPVGTREAVRVPASAVVRVGQLETVVVRDDPQWIRRLVTTGMRFDDGAVEVLSGLDPGDVIGVPGPGDGVSGPAGGAVKPGPEASTRGAGRGAGAPAGGRSGG